jgi:hypothetical protein
MITPKQAKFLARGLKGLGMGGGVAAGVYAFRAANRAGHKLFGQKPISVEEFNARRDQAGWGASRTKLYSDVRAGNLNIKGSSTFRPFAGKAKWRGLTPRPKLAP